MKQCIGHEVLFGLFLKKIDSNIITHIEKIGVNGLIAVSYDLLDN